MPDEPALVSTGNAAGGGVALSTGKANAEPKGRVGQQTMAMSDIKGVLPVLCADLESGSITFGDLFECYFGSKGLALPGSTITPLEQAAYNGAYPAVRKAFKNAYGLIEDDYWTANLRAAVVKTRKSAPGSLARLWTIIDWDATDIDVIPLLTTADRLDIKSRGLSGADRDTCGSLLYAVYTEIIDAIDRHHAPVRAPYDPRELELIREHLNDIDDFYRKAIEGRANPLYFSGVMLGAFGIVVLGIALLLTGVTLPAPLSRTPSLGVGFAFGALGAVFSVLLRLGDEEMLVKRAETAPGMLRLYGALRPLIGGTSAFIIQVFLASGLLGIPQPADSADKAAFFVIALSLSAGFSERWVKDVLGKAPTLATGPEAASAPAAGGQRGGGPVPGGPAAPPGSPAKTTSRPGVAPHEPSIADKGGVPHAEAALLATPESAAPQSH